MRPQSGFSLLELAIAIVILAAILGSVAVPIATQMQAKKIKETEQLLEDAKEALMGFALSNGRLPCPDIDVPPDGVENTLCPPGAGVTAVEGFLPWNTLSVPPTDAWGRLFHYAVTGEFAASTVTPNECTPGGTPGVLELDLCDNGTIRVDTFGATALVNQISAIAVSTGPNGLGGSFLSGATLPNPPAGATDETNNLITTPSNQRFVSRPYFDDAPAGCVDPACNFDDLVVWLSTPILFNRMVAAGRLP